MSNEPAICTMELTPDMERLFKGEPYFLEIEMLQGEREVLEDGRVKYIIEVHDPQKQEIIKEFCLKMISKSHLNNGN